MRRAFVLYVDCALVHETMVVQGFVGAVSVRMRSRHPLYIKLCHRAHVYSLCAMLIGPKISLRV